MPEHHCRHCCTHKKDRESPRRRYYNPYDPDRFAYVDGVKVPLDFVQRQNYQRQEEEIKEDDEHEERMCPICFFDETADNPINTRCNSEEKGQEHFFHEQCLRSYIDQDPANNNDCPMCRRAPCDPLAVGPVLDPLGSVAWQLANNIENCPICDEPASDDDPLSAICNNELPESRHYFHEHCLDGWVNSGPPHVTNNCPLCRSPNCRVLPPPLPHLPGPHPPEPIPPPVIGVPPGPWDPIPMHRQIAAEMPCFTCFRTTGNDCGRCRTCHAVYGPPQNAQTAAGNNVVCDGSQRIDQ